MIYTKFDFEIFKTMGQIYDQQVKLHGLVQIIQTGLCMFEYKLQSYCGHGEKVITKQQCKGRNNTHSFTIERLLNNRKYCDCHSGQCLMHMDQMPQYCCNKHTIFKLWILSQDKTNTVQFHRSASRTTTLSTNKNCF